jgi:hypothetical protein
MEEANTYRVAESVKKKICVIGLQSYISLVVDYSSIT